MPITAGQPEAGLTTTTSPLSTPPGTSPNVRAVPAYAAISPMRAWFPAAAVSQSLKSATPVNRAAVIGWRQSRAMSRYRNTLPTEDGSPAAPALSLIASVASSEPGELPQIDAVDVVPAPVSSAVVLIRPLISWSSRRSVRTAQTWPECSAALAVATALPNAANDIGCRIRRSRSATVLIPCVMMPPTLPTTERMASGSVRCSPAMALPSAVTALVGSVSSPKEPDGRQKYPPQRPREWQPSLEPMRTWPPTGPPHRQVREG